MVNRLTKIFVPTMGLVLSEVKSWWTRISEEFSLQVEPVSSPFIAISRQRIMMLGLATEQSRVVSLDDDVILPDDALYSLLTEDVPLNLITYPAKDQPLKVVAGDHSSHDFPDDTFPSRHLWHDRYSKPGQDASPRISITDPSPNYFSADWCGLGAFSISKRYLHTAPYLDVTQFFNPWQKATMFIGEDITYLSRLSTWAPSSFWSDYAASYKHFLSSLPTDWRVGKFIVGNYPLTKHLQRY